MNACLFMSPKSLADNRIPESFIIPLWKFGEEFDEPQVTVKI